MSPELSTATSAVRKPGLLPRFWLWRIAALLLVVVPLTAAAVSWQRIFPPLPADCGQPANAVRSGAVAQYCFFKRLPQFGQSSMTAGPDGSIWSTEWSKIARITPDGTLTEFPASSNGQIITGPDGNLWFTTTSPEGNTKLVRMNPHGNIEVFTKSPDVPVGPMIVGPDGRLWTVSGGVTGGPHALAKITLTGTVTVLPYPLPDQMQKEEDPESGITDLASGSDGNVWFVETVYFTGPENGIVFGRITPSGAVTIFPTVLERGSGPPLGGGSGSRKGALAAGRDGNLWFLGYEGQISRITPKGTVTRFRVPEQTVQENPLIIAGPDGNVWFSAGRGKIGRITPSGAVTLFPLSQQAQIGALAAGPDGHIWFLRSDNTMSGYGWWTQIGRITP